MCIWPSSQSRSPLSITYGHCLVQCFVSIVASVTCSILILTSYYLHMCLIAYHACASPSFFYSLVPRVTHAVVNRTHSHTPSCPQFLRELCKTVTACGGFLRQVYDIPARATGEDDLRGTFGSDPLDEEYVQNWFARPDADSTMNSTLNLYAFARLRQLWRKMYCSLIDCKVADGSAQRKLRLHAVFRHQH